MPRLHRTITVPRPVSEVFDYVADFRTVAEWDPGIAAAEQTSGDGPAIGAVYAVTAVFGDRRIPMSYRTIALDAPVRVTLEGEGATIAAIDDITFKDKGDGTTQIDYVADLNMKGLLRLGHPLLRGAFDKLADKAMSGLQQALS